MSLISLNGNPNVPQPSDLTEEYIQIMMDKATITGLTRRIWLAQKRQATFKLSAISSSDYNLINSYIEGGNLIAYSNSNSGFAFSGFATSAAASYLRGASLLRDMTITILEQ